jgi:hypothetical protein
MSEVVSMTVFEPSYPTLGVCITMTCYWWNIVPWTVDAPKAQNFMAVILTLSLVGETAGFLFLQAKVLTVYCLFIIESSKTRPHPTPLNAVVMRS